MKKTKDNMNQPPAAYCWYTEGGIRQDDPTCDWCGTDEEWFQHMIKIHDWSESLCLSEWNIGVADKDKLTEVPK